MAGSPLTSSADGSGSTLLGKVHHAADVVHKVHGIVQAARIARPYVMGGARFLSSLL